ncbi:MAG: SDR family NAD(P)-dependent oxidoreductase [Myxococcota bacterium]|nr:SDR family NAD(P)-dependent oxidoreductase [Myxococcota bacterium]
MHVVVTGGTGGIGTEVVRALVAAKAQVLVGGRGSTPPLDLAALASVRAYAAWVDAHVPAVDVLILNAGVWPRQRRATADGLELAFGVNHVAHHALATALLPALRRSPAPRVVTVASGLHARGTIEWDDLLQARGGFDGRRAYAQSKLANVMFALALARRLHGVANLTSNAVHPGLVRTGLTREYPELFRDTPPRAIVSPAVAARAIVRLARDPALARVTGRYFDRDREVAPSKAALRVPDQDRLWRATEALIAAASR